MQEKPVTIVICFFSKNGELVYCNYVEGILQGLRCTLCSKERRRFLDLSKFNSKTVLLYIYIFTSQYWLATLSTWRKQTRIWIFSWKLLKIWLEYMCRSWSLRVAPRKAVWLHKILLFFFERDNRTKEKHYKIKDWPMRENSVLGEKFVRNWHLFYKDKILLRPLDIKLVFMKSSAKAMKKRAKCFEYLRKNFPKFSDTKLKENIWFHGSVHHSKNHLEITNKMRPCVRISYSNVYKLLNMFRGTHRSSSEAQKLQLQSLGLHTFVVVGSCHQPQTYVNPGAAIAVVELLMMSVVSLDTCWEINKRWNKKF
jgi:hypothetical protein